MKNKSITNEQLQITNETNRNSQFVIRHSIVPKLRFPEFENDGDWKEDILGNRGVFTGGGTPSKSNKCFWEGNLPWVSSSDIYEYSIHKIDVSRFITKEAIKKSATKIVAENSLLIVSRVGVGKLAVSKNEICTSQDFTNFTPDKDDLVFLGYYLKSKSQLLLSFSQGMAIKGFTKDDIYNLELNFPKNPKEQQKIANCLSSLDHLITAEIEKLDHLKDHKKGLLQQLFPVKGETKPQFRFPEFENDGDWEEKPLDKIVGKFIVPMRDKPKKLDGNIPWCRIEDFNGMYLSQSKTNQGVTKDTIQEMNLKVYPLGTLLVSCSADLGRCAITSKELITNQTFIGLVPIKELVNTVFLYYVMSNSKGRLNARSSGTTISYLSRQEFEKFEIKLPNPKEQQKIANCLSSADELIEAQTTKIKALKKHKKGLMQQLFPNVNELAI